MFKFTLVNFNSLMYKDNAKDDKPYILATHAEQVCYIFDTIELDWQVVIKMTLMNIFYTDFGSQKSIFLAFKYFIRMLLFVKRIMFRYKKELKLCHLM